MEVLKPLEGVACVCLARLDRLNIPSQPARRSLGEVGREALIIGRRFQRRLVTIPNRPRPGGPG
jgi:hypothetical protein